MMKTTLKSIGLFYIAENETTHYGAQQEWYTDEWQRKAGCGPTVCAMLLWYLSQTRKELAGLCPYDGTRREEFLNLMHEVWQYVTPGKMGVNTTRIFTEGALRYAADKGVGLKADVIDIPKAARRRPGEMELAGFVQSALENNLPVAFLNLSNGALSNLDSWHWVTVVAFDAQTMRMDICDKGVIWTIDAAQWLRTTVLGGGLVVLRGQ